MKTGLSRLGLLVGAAFVLGGLAISGFGDAVPHVVVLATVSFALAGWGIGWLLGWALEGFGKSKKVG